MIKLMNKILNITLVIWLLSKISLEGYLFLF